MINKNFWLIAFFLFPLFSIAQEQKNDSIPTQEAVVIQDTVAFKKTIDPLAPSRAAFYSAVLPGLGQAYNKRYWKIPIVYGALGTSIYFYKRNGDFYDRYRDAYKSRLAGNKTDEFYGVDENGNPRATPLVSDQALRDAQDFYQRNRDLSLLITLGLYVLNIIDANVDAHLKQYNVNDDLTFKPYIYQNQFDSRINYGI